MTLSLGMITVDTTDAESLARWWAERLGATVQATNDGWFVVLEGGGLPTLLAFQKVEDPTPGKNRIHLDLGTEDLEAEAEALVAAGATLIARREESGFAWITLADPDGNQFCIARHGAAEGGSGA